MYQDMLCRSKYHNIAWNECVRWRKKQTAKLLVTNKLNIDVTPC